MRARVRVRVRVCVCVCVYFHVPWIKLGSAFGTGQIHLVTGKDTKDSITQLNLNTDGSRCKKTCLRGFANNAGADQPAHSRRLISACVIHFLQSILSKLAASEISIL